MENLKETIYKKYGVKDFQELIRYFEIKTSVPFEDLEIKDASIYHSPRLILDKVKDSQYSPLEEKVLLLTTFLDSFYGIDYTEIGEIMSVFGTFKTYYLFKEVLEGNIFYEEFINLYHNYIDRLGNLGIIIINEGKQFIEKLDGFISELQPETITSLLNEFTEKLSGIEILG